MTKNLTSALLVQAEPPKLSCEAAQPGPRAAGRFPSSIRLWRRAICTAVVPLLMTLCVQTGSAQTALLNGTNQSGTLVVNTTNAYTFTASAGDNVVLRLGSTGFSGRLNLQDPTGALVKSAGGNSTDWELAYTVTSGGVFTVLVSSYYTGGAGSFVLHLAQFPEPFIVPSGDEGGPMTNGGSHTGTLTLGDLELWSFTANAGDNVVLRLGSTGFQGNLRLYVPDGTLLMTSGGNSTDWKIAFTATKSGTHTVLVSSFYPGGTGTYVLHLAQFPEPFIVPTGDEGGPMTNGGNYSGTLTLGDLEMWSFTANAGDNIVLRLGSTGFEGNLNLYGPNGALLKTAGGNSTDWELAYTATNSGTFTVLVGSYYPGGVGTYALHLAQFPEAFIVPASEEGGPLTNGGNFGGALTLGDQNMWSFTANAGDNFVLRLGSTGFEGNLNLYGPNGALLKTAGGNSTDWELAYTATNSGTFVVLVSSYYREGVGTYVLHLARFPDGSIVPSGDLGGGMTGTASYDGTINLGDLDVWTFTACTGDLVSLRLNSTNFEGNLDLYGPTGALLKRAGGNATTWSISYTATNCGTFGVLVRSYYAGGTGTYGLTVNGLSVGLKLCLPVISGARLNLNGVGGSSGTNFVLYSSTSVVQPFSLWTPVLTN
jgi:trimeric autotransporter adhesin